MSELIINVENDNLLKNTSSKISDFFQIEAVANRGTKTEHRTQNPLTIQQQESIITQILSRCVNIKDDNIEKIYFYLGGAEMQRIERNFKNFSTIMKIAFSELSYIEKTDKKTIIYETINLPKLFEVIKTRPVYRYTEAKSVFTKEEKLQVDNRNNLITSVQKLHFEFEAKRNVPEEAQKEIVEAINKHWRGHIPEILDYLVAGQYNTDKKQNWLLIMAYSNFGKSKLFEWMRVFGATAFIDFKDMIASGPSDISPELIMYKIFLVIDEAMKFHRKFFKIEGTVPVRPMGKHTVEVEAGVKVMLSADGGQFNSKHIEKQEQNRVPRIDLRYVEDKTELGDIAIVKKYNEYVIAKTMELYLYRELKKRITAYEDIDSMERTTTADKVSKAFFEKYKYQAPNFFEMLDVKLREIFENPKEALDEKHYFMYCEAVENMEYKGQNGYFIKRPASTLPKLVAHYDSTLEYEMSFKTIEQISENLNYQKIATSINGESKRGLFIAKKIRLEKMDKNGNLVSVEYAENLPF